MSQSSGLANAIETIVNQVETTTMDIGHTTGHYISSGQVNVLRKAIIQLRKGIPALDNYEQASSSRTAETGHSVLWQARNRLQEARLELQVAELSLTTAARGERTELNHTVGKLKSEITRLQKILPENQQ
ncbi:hypothetical protein MMC31_008168 [Peltigera leucophlebia]|nr:hypothetical protein [Peltigera leucophlebia]